MIVNPKGEMKGSAITGPVAKECVRCLPPTTFVFTDGIYSTLITGRLVAAYCIECWYSGIRSAVSLLFPRYTTLMLCTASHDYEYEKHKIQHVQWDQQAHRLTQEIY